MPDRCRLFFRFASHPVMVIVCVWCNDDDTLREAGAMTDVYEAFKRMLARGSAPANIHDLLSGSVAVQCRDAILSRMSIQSAGSSWPKAGKEATP